MLGFTVKQLEHIPTVGEKLQKARETMEVGLEQVAKNLKIRTIYLQNLEADAYEKMPADVYTKGFIKKYALFLNLDPQITFTDYEKEKKGKLLKNPSSYSELPSIKRPFLDVTPKTITKIVVSLISIFIGVYFIYQLDFLLGAPKITLNSPMADLVVNNDKIEFMGKVELNSNLTINNQEVYIDKEGNFKEEIILHQGLNTIEMTAKNRFGKSVSVVRRIIKE